MKRAYTKPGFQIVRIQQTHLICSSDWDVIGPGQPNQPAGAPSLFDNPEWDALLGE